MPQFRFNLVFVTKLLLDLKCNLTFDHHGCHVQEHLMKRHWLLGNLKSGLYVFEGSRLRIFEFHEEGHKAIIDCNSHSAAVSTSVLNKAKL